MFVIILLLLGPAICCAGGLAATTVTSRWFLRRRGRALGVVTVASSAGGFVMVPLVTALIESFGWRQALTITGIAAGLIVVGIAMLFVRDKPDAELRDQSDEFLLDQSAVDSTRDVVETEWRLERLLANKNFWLISFGAGFLLASDQAILTSKYPYLVESGFTAIQASSIISAMTFSAIGGKLVVGFLADHKDIRHLFALVGVFHLGLLLILLLMPGYLALIIFASFFGAAVGGIYPVWAALIANNFGAKSFGLVFGSTAMVMQLLAIVFVRLIGEVYDRYGSYENAFYFFLIAVTIGIGLVYLTDKNELPVTHDAKPAMD